jgi:glutathionylspermidine synthase
MRFLERRMSAAGLAAHVVAPDQIQWGGGGAGVRTEWASGPVGAIVRFFPGEWLPALGRRSGWQRFCRDGSTLLCNPGTALISQSKRFPLVWEALRAPMRRWRALLPETRDPRGVRGEHSWVLKPAMGRVGEGVLIRGVTPAAEAGRAARAARRRPWAWAAQRRFRAVPVRDGAGGECYPCVGVFVIDGRAAGAYGRVARAPLIDRRARDAAMLVREVAPSRRREGVRGGQAAVV